MTVLDALAAAGVIAGSLLVALGAIGTVRFPDVLTRMHGATKAATVGVIGTTLAATLKAGSIGAVLILVIVVALLFLSGPLGMSLLARAAYHDPETPRSTNTRELTFSIPTNETTVASVGKGTNVPLALWLFAVWVAAFGSITVNVVIGGLIVSSIVAIAFRHLSPTWPRALRHPVAALRFARYFVHQLAVSTWGVIASLLIDPAQLRPAVIEVPLRMRGRSEITLLMNTISFTPGTVALELHHQSLYVHVLDTTEPEIVVAGIHEMENRILAMFGTLSQPHQAQPRLD